MSRAEQSRAEQSRAEQRRFFLKKAFKFLAFGLPVFFLKKPDKLQSPFQNLNVDSLLNQAYAHTFSIDGCSVCPPKHRQVTPCADCCNCDEICTH